MGRDNRFIDANNTSNSKEKALWHTHPVKG
jgi:hypothetical protein